MLNYAQLGDKLNITGAGAKKRLLKFETELKDYCIYNENGKLIGYQDSVESIEAIRNIKAPLRRSKVVARELDTLKQENASMSLKMAYMEKELALKDEMIMNYDKQFKQLSLIVDNLVKVKEKPRLLGFFKRK